jgi:uncharacterized protein
MHNQPGFPRIDGFRFAETGDVLRGKCRIAGLGRLQDLLASNAGELDYELHGTTDEAGRPSIRVRIGGELQLTCQRCLKALAHELRIDELLVLAKSEAEIESQPVDPEKPDRVLGEKEMEVGTLLEDEILLAVPVAPRHEQCSAAESVKKGGAQASPFSGLRGLLDRGGRARN